MSLLSVDTVCASYGPTKALFGVSLQLNEGDVLALMGRNGMGKSTTINTICGLLPASSGSLVFNGVDITNLPSHKVAQLGIGLVPEGRRVFRSLSVEENLLSAARPGAWTLKRVHDLFPKLAERSSQRASQLSGGEQQMLAIGRALMTNPSVLMLDEATEGLAPLVRAEIWSVISELKRDTGLAIIVVDKTIKELQSVADQVVILERGSSVWNEPMSALSSSVITQYLGV